MAKYTVDIFENVIKPIPTYDVFPNEDNIFCRINAYTDEGKDKKYAIVDLCTVIGDFIGRASYLPNGTISVKTYDHPFYLWYDNEEIRMSEEEGLLLVHKNLNDLLTKTNNLANIDLIEFDKIANIFYAKVNPDIEYKNDSEILRYLKEENIEAPVYEKPSTIEELYNLDVNTPLHYTYRCNNINQVVFSILHYYVLHKYKITTCKHCKNIFATTNLKNEYCNRNSPYKSKYIKQYKEKGYDRLNCKLAVDNIKQQLQNRWKSINAYWHNWENFNQSKFLSDSQKFRDIIKIQPTVENLEKYEKFLYDKKWFEGSQVYK